MKARSNLERNLEVLAARDPELAKAIAHLRPETYELVPSAKPGVPNLLHRRPGRPPLLHYDPNDPLTHSSSFLRGMEPERAHILVLLGVGLGYGLSQLSRVLDSPKSPRKLFVVEKDPECFRMALQVCDLNGVLASPSVELLVGVPQESLFIRLAQALWPEMLHAKALKFLPWPGALASDPDYYLGVRKAVSEAISTWMGSLGNDPFDTLVAYDHFLRNSLEVMAGPRLSRIKDLFPGRPAVVVASGPSLNKNVHLLKLVEDRAVILSVDASWRILKGLGIRPHMVTSVERTPGTHRFVEGLDKDAQCVYAMVSFIFPETLASYKGPRVFVNRAYNFFHLLGMGEDCLAMGNSTAHMAFKIAAYMGCDPIILIGQDLAFDSSGLTHAQGCVHGEKQTFFHDDKALEVPGNVEPTVKTCSTWFKFLKQYEQHLSEYQGTCINATEGGARICGTLVMSFSEAIELHCRDPFGPREVLLSRLREPLGNGPAQFAKGVSMIQELSRRTLGWCKEGLEALTVPLAQVEARAGTGQERIPPPLASSLRNAVDRVGQILDRLIWDPGPVRQLGEYLLQPCGIPFACEWQVVGERFRDEAWGMAYRLKLARDFFSTLGQLCLSLDHVFQENRDKLNALGVPCPA